MLIEPPKTLLSIAYFHLPTGKTPTAFTIEPGMEWVELMTHGRAWCEDQGKWKEIGPGDLLWQMPGDKTTGRADPRNRYRSLAVKFASKADIGQRRVPRFSQWPKLFEVEKFIRHVLALYMDSTFDRQSLLWYVFSRLNFQASLWHHECAQAQPETALEKVRLKIESAYQDTLTVEDLAKETGWTPGHFHERFKEAFEMTPYEALTRRRIRAAQELLAGSDLPIKVIADESGFSQASVFCHAFRRQVGESPTAFRKRHYQPHSGNFTQRSPSPPNETS